MEKPPTSEENSGILVAGVVYAFMNQNYHVSRNVRTQWFFRHLHRTVSFCKENELCSETEIKVLSIYPQDPPADWGPETSSTYQYLITPNTNVVYLSKNNKAVYCLDLSPSISAVDIQHGQVMLDEIISAMKNSIEGIIRRFIVPGTHLVFEPHLFVTVIVHTPFFTTPAQQVLVQGWRVTEDNVDEFLSAIVKQLELLEDTIADVSGLVHDEIDNVRLKQAESERLVGGLFEEIIDKQSSLSNSISMVGPDSGFINLLRYGMLALRLLPNCNLSSLIVITDGMITLPDIHVLDSVLTQLRSNAVAVSFLHVGSQFHPHSSHGLVPYTELMEFIALATLGTYIHSPPITTECDNFNLYHEAFITWSFRKKSSLQSLLASKSQSSPWRITNSSFYGNRDQHLLTKKQNEEHLIASLTSVLCCRLHEGYMIKSVHLRDKELEITMVLPWSNLIYIEYIITSEWPSCSFKNLVHFSLSIKAPYEFLHDITCLMKKPFHSPYRQAVVSRFWGTLKTLSHTDVLLSHLDSFSDNSLAYTVPESIKNGMPLFYLPTTNHGPPELSSSGSSCPQFAQFWRPVVLLEPSVWQKWLHTHRLGLILQPDHPFPHSLHLINFNSPSQYLQCRQAEALLYNCLKKMATFVLIENHSYIKIMPCMENEKGPSWFYIVRVTSKPPCAVIHIAFLGGTPGSLRHQVVEEIKEELSKLRIPQRSDSVRKYESDSETHHRAEVNCCIFIQKPLEKILIRYERMPCEFGTVIFPDGTQPVSAAKPLKPASTLITTLSRYLHHKRSIWDAHTPLASHNNLLPTMLTTLTRMRLQEGFHFAHCTAGIINMVMEVQMKCYDEEDSENLGKFQPCIIQYILFPPHMTSTSTKGSNSGDEMNDENESELRTELITECWIEPQHGVVTESPSHRGYMEKLHYHQIADVIWRVDAECISNLLTFDHLQLMCHNQQIVPPLSLDPSSLHQNPLENWPHAVAIEDERIHRIPFAYNLMNLLPKCQQAELLSSTFIQELTDDWECKTRNDAPNSLLMENFVSQLQELHHRELTLSDHESSQLLEFIITRSRDSLKYPIPFPTDQKKFESRKVSDAESTDTGDTMPAGSDWSRMISWATFPPETSSPSHGSSDDIKNLKKTSRLPPWYRKSKPPSPKWRCFVKSMASTHCVLTFIPASFQDLKLLMLGPEGKSLKHINMIESEETNKTSKLVMESNLNPEAEPFHPRLPLGSETPCRNSSKSSSRILGTNASDDDLVFDSVSGIKETSKTIFDSPFRDRSSSWDPMKRQSEQSKFDLRRARTSSVGAKIKPQHWGILKKASEEDEEIIKNRRTFVAALTLPIYVYDCPLSNLVDALIFKTGIERRPDIYLNQNHTNKKGIDKEDAFERKNENYSATDELDLQYHCKVILQTFNKCFVVALFKSLHLNHKINHVDIQSAIDECEETLLEIDITKYMQTICGHFKQIMLDDLKCKNLSSVMSLPCQTSEVMPLHKLIKQRFIEILTVCFKAVPTFPDYYFCCPAQHSRMVVDNLEFDNVTLQSDLIEFSSNQNSLPGVWERIGLDSTFDDARTSLLSNMDSDSISDSLYDVGDDLFPLFLRLVCSIRNQNKDILLSNAVKLIPTCLGELLDEDKLNDSFLDWSKSPVSLDLHCLTLPVLYPADLPLLGEGGQHQEAITGPTPPAICDAQISSDQQHCSSENLKSIESLQHLPFQQHKAISICLTEIEWFLNDEIAVFLLDSPQITESILTFVTNHVSNSIGRYSCLLNTVNLNFVFEMNHSLEKFIQEISHMKVPGYKISKEGDYYYVLKDPSAPTPAKFYTFPSIADANAAILSAEDTKNFDEGNSITSASDLRSENEWEFMIKGYCSNASNKWITELNDCRKELPNFWLILKVDEEKVTTFFHCRFLEIHSEEIQHYRDVHSQVLTNIEAVCKTVNQTLLLQSLHESRLCDPLLEPETSDDIWKPNQLLVRSQEESSDIDIRGSFTDISQKFQPGWFSCPVVWQTHFLLHPRLKTGPGKPGLSRAIQALRTVLNRFSVNNRTNMFVYRDNLQNNVFYLRLHENTRCTARPPTIEDDSSPGSVSRSSSFNSLSARRPLEEFSSKEILPKLKSFEDSSDNISRQEDFLTLKVHGISPAGIEVKNELVQVLQNRLDDAVLEVVSVMLARNPMCKLSPDDVHFIQKPFRSPDEIIQLTLPDYSFNYLEALLYYLKQNLMQFLFLPKYIDPRTQFQDYSQPEGSSKKINESSFYLYNQSPASGNKGIACLAIAFVDKLGDVIQHLETGAVKIRNLNVDLTDEESFNEVTCCDSLSDSNNLEPDVLLEMRIWKQGRINMEAFVKKLKSTVQYALWDLITEFFLLRTPLLMNTDNNSRPAILNFNYHKILPKWLKYGFTLSVPAVKTHSIELASRHAVNITLKEINQFIISQEPATFVFCENSTTSEDAILIGWEDEIPSSSNCLIISGSMPQLKSIIEMDSVGQSEPEVKNPKSTKKTISYIFSPMDSNQQSIPRQTLALALISNREVELFMYNWSKDRVENITKHLSHLGQWLSSRSNFLTSIIYQKMGLFHNQPFMRKSTSQIGFPEVTDLESLLTFSHTASRKVSFNSLANYTQVLRDAEPTTFKKVIHDPVHANINQITTIKTNDKREQQKKLRLMWQSRSSTPYIPMSEDTMELFMRYSRIIHYCLTPLLFLPHWRLQSAATRDQFLQVSPVQTADYSTQRDCSWHEKMCAYFMMEYKQYLQSLGFTPVQMTPSTPQKIPASEKTSSQSKCYLQKSLLGGVLMFEISLFEPFFHVKLHALECSRLQGKSTSPIMSQIIFKFLEECDRIKVSMHLHSFTYDYHLRSLHGFISDQQSLFESDYHATSFLDDFLKYYPKAPNFARNLVYSGSLCVSDLVTPALQLFNFLLRHSKDYGLDIKRLSTNEKSSDDKLFQQECDYILVKFGPASNISYQNVHDIKHIDELDMTLIITYDKSSRNTVIKLHYYIILTTNRDLYPKLEMEWKLGKFVTVSTVSSPNPQPKADDDPIDINSDTEIDESKINLENEPGSDHLEIRQEAVNYLGYYSTHEQLMHNIIVEEASAACKSIENMVKKGSIDCRVHLLWDKLLSNNPSNTLSYAELFEMKDLAFTQSFLDLDPRLGPMLHQPVSWYQGLMKLLMAKYNEKHKLFASADSNNQHLLILHPRFLDGFVMLSIDLTSNIGVFKNIAVMEWPVTKVLDLITSSRKALWDPHDPLYKDRYKKKDIWKDIADELLK